MLALRARQLQGLGHLRRGEGVRGLDLQDQLVQSMRLLRRQHLCQVRLGGAREVDHPAAPFLLAQVAEVAAGVAAVVRQFVGQGLDLLPLARRQLQVVLDRALAEQPQLAGVFQRRQFPQDVLDPLMIRRQLRLQAGIGAGPVDEFLVVRQGPSSMRRRTPLSAGVFGSSSSPSRVKKSTARRAR